MTDVNVIFAILAILGTVVGVWATNSKRHTEVETQSQLAEIKIKLSDAENDAADSDTARKKAEAEIKERADLLEMIKGLSKGGADFLLSLQEIRKEKEADYETLKAIADTNAQIMVSEVQKSREAIISEIKALDTAIQISKTNTIEMVATEFAAVFASKLNEQMVLQTQYPFPSSSDPDWVEDFVKPIVSHSWIYNRPYATEDTRSQVELKNEGQNVELIRGWKKDWLAVRFVAGNKAVFGWVQEHEVRIGLTAIRLITGENPTVNLNPATAAT